MNVPLVLSFGLYFLLWGIWETKAQRSERKEHHYILSVSSDIRSTSEPNTRQCLFELSVMRFPCFCSVWCGLRPSPLCFLRVWKDETCFRPERWESLRLSRTLLSGDCCLFEFHSTLYTFNGDGEGGKVLWYIKGTCCTVCADYSVFKTSIFFSFPLRNKWRVWFQIHF